MLFTYTWVTCSSTLSGHPSSSLFFFNFQGIDAWFTISNLVFGFCGKWRLIWFNQSLVICMAWDCSRWTLSGRLSNPFAFTIKTIKAKPRKPLVKSLILVGWLLILLLYHGNVWGHCLEEFAGFGPLWEQVLLQTDETKSATYCMMSLESRIVNGHETARLLQNMCFVFANSQGCWDGDILNHIEDYCMYHVYI